MKKISLLALSNLAIKTSSFGQYSLTLCTDKAFMFNGKRFFRLGFIILFILFASSTYGTNTILDNRVFNSTDVTNIIRDAINSTADTVLIKNVGGPWIVQPITIFNKENKTIIFEEGVVLQAKSGAFTLDNGTLFKLKDCSNIKIYGYGATFHMLKSEYTEGEHRHAIDLSDCNNITIAGLLVNDSGGDGLIITGYAGGTNNQYFCNNIYVVDCVFDNNRRQGCSIISAKNVLIDNCTFSNTKGTLPENGIDIEPDHHDDLVQNIRIRKCRFTNNFGPGLSFGFYRLTSASPPVSVSVDDCYFSYNRDASNIYQPAEISYTEPKNENLTGLITFNRCFVDGSQWPAVAATKSAHNMPLVFNDCVFKDVSKNPEYRYNYPIWIEVQAYDDPINYLGGISFTKSTLKYSSNFKFARINGWSNSPGAKNISMDLTVIHPTLNTVANNSAEFSNVLSQVNVNFDIKYLNDFPTKRLTLGSISSEVISKKNCTRKEILLSSTTASSFPIAINYAISGTASNRIDYHQLKGFMLLEQNTIQSLDSLHTINPQLNNKTLSVLL
ncbi:MAG TPA: right-handed parallel beta-helix repeat-containing protein, partial [Cytophagaceae bacterium]